MANNQTDQLVDWIRNRYFGKYRGVVTDPKDPTNRGRLKVRVPAVLADLESWAMPCVPYAGKGIGAYVLPEVGSGVWVEFEQGDPSYPIWTGCFWADNELPKDEKGKAAVPPMKIIRSQKGLMVKLDDQKQELTLSDQNGNNIVTIEVQKGKITVKGKMKVVVEAPQIELVENATHPVVFGDTLLSYLNQLVQLFNAHVHPATPSPTGPPVPPLQPPAPTVLSNKVKSG